MEAPGYLEAVAIEKWRRSVASINLPQIVGGVEIQQMTPFSVEWLNVLKNPFAVGGSVTDADVLQFILVHQPFFPADQETHEEFINNIGADLDLIDAQLDIENLVESTFADALPGKESIPYFSLTASLVYQMGDEPFRWKKEETIHTPIPFIFQVLRVKHKVNGGNLINDHSDRIRLKWINQLNAENAQS